MHRRSPSLGVTLSGIVMLGATLAGTAWSQPGTVISHKKINSDTLVTFGAAMSNRDEVGDSVADLGDLDGAGPSVTALALGAVGDDDGGNRGGSVYILFLNPAGHVRSLKKISALQGNFTGVLDADSGHRAAELVTLRAVCSRTRRSAARRAVSRRRSAPATTSGRTSPASGTWTAPDPGARGHRCAGR
jgi:hypothetical protein